MVETNGNPYEAPAEVDDFQEVESQSVFAGSLLRPAQPGKVACFWLLGWGLFYLTGSIFVSGYSVLQGDMVVEAAFFVFPAAGLFVGVEQVRRLVLYVCGAVAIAVSLALVAFLLMGVFGSTEVTHVSATLFGVTTQTLGSSLGVIAFQMILPVYLFVILWGRRCNGKPIGPGIFSSAKNGVNSRESHHGKQS